MKKTLRVALSTGICSLSCLLTLSLRGAELQELTGHVPAILKGKTAVSRLPGTNRLNLAIALPLRNREALTNLLQDIYNPASSHFHQYLTPEQFTEQFGPTTADVEAVAAFARASGFTVTATHANRLLVDVNASVADIEKAFHVTMRTYAHPLDNRICYAPDTEPSLALSVPLAHISGLDNAALPRPRYHVAALANVKSNAGSGPSGTYAGKDFRAAYAPDTTLTGAGQMVGMLEFDGYTTSDITHYETSFGLPNVTLTNVLLDGFNGSPTGDGGEVEVSLDIEMSLSMAPGLSGIIVYEAGPNGNWHDILNRMATDNLARQLSCSWYIPGGPSDPVADGIFQQMSAQGQSFFNASGDSDAYSGLISFPGDTPYVTEVGGTTLTTIGPAGAWSLETVWNWGIEYGPSDAGVGSSGGISTQYSIPAYQTNISMANNQGSTTMRNIPDVALTADNVYTRADGFDFNVGGTSCAAPLWAGFAALANQQAAATGAPPLGFINPALDAIGTGAIYSLLFNDITNGNNTSPSSPTKFYAITGYDLCTGWGTPAGQKLINALANPEPLLILPVQGFTAIGAAGGPFTVSSQSLTLTNTGTNALNWTVTNTASWLNVTPVSGTLASAGPATTVIVSLNAAASNLMVGTYTTTLWFTNLNDNVGQGLQYKLRIILPPVITAQPSNQTLLDGQTAQFTATVTGGLPLSYQWQLNGTNLTDGENILGSGTNTLTITAASTSNAGTYVLEVTNAAGTAVSSNAVLTITPSAPVITQQPSNQTVYVGFSAQFSVAAVGSKPFFYQWSLNGTNLNGATNATLALANLQFTNAGNYAVVVSNSLNGTLSSNALLTVNPLPPCDPPPSGIVSWWPAQSNALDSAGGNNGTLVGSVTYGPGEVGEAFVFPGSGSGVALGDPTNLWLQNFTFEAWVQRTGSAISTNGLDELFIGGSSGGYGFGIKPDGRFFLTQVDDNNVTIQAGVTDTNWHHVAVTKNGSAVVFYLDGVAYSGGSYNPGFNFNGNVALGARGDTFNNGFYGSIDELSVYNRGLTASEIQLIYVVGSEGKCPLPPVITSQPASQTAYVGNTVIFSVAADGTAPFSYQWAFNGTNILAGATNASLTVTGIQLTSAGNYSVLVSNSAGSALSSNAVLTVNPTPACDPQPSGLVSWWRAESNALDAVSGNNGTLTGGVTYGPGEVGQAFVFPGNGSAVQLGNPASLELQTFTIETWIQRTGSAIVTNGTDEQFIGSGSGGYGFGLHSNGQLFLTRIDATAVTAQAAVTDTGWHHVAVTLNSGILVFYLDGAAYPGGSYNPGFSSGNLAIGARGDNLQNNFLGSIDELSVYNRALTATEIQLLDAAGSAGKCPLPPTITSQPANQAGYVGDNIILSVAATGTLPFSYQWIFNSTNLLAGATNISLTLTNLQLNQAGNYEVLVTNAYGSALSSNAVLAVNPTPSCTPPPSGLVSWWQAEGNALDTAGTNNGVLDGGITYGPGEVGQAFVFSGNGSAVQLGSAASLQLQTTFSVEAWVQRTGSAIVSGGTDELLIGAGNNGYGFGFKSAGQLFLTQIGNTAIVSQAAVSDTNWHHVAVTLSGGAVVFYLDGVAYPGGAYNPGFASGSVALGARGDNLQNNLVGSLDELAVYNRALATSEIQVIYGAGAGGKCPIPATIAAQPTNETVNVGGNTAFTVVATGTRPLSYQWLFNGTNTLAGATNAVLSLTNVQLTGAGTYSVTVSNLAGTTSSSNAVLTVLAYPPVIVTQPTNETVNAGSAANFTVVVSGTPPLSYQWLFNGTNTIAGATNTVLSLPNVQSASAGTYSVIVTNLSGTATSSNAVLTVLTFPPTITLQPTNQTIYSGVSAVFTVNVSGSPPLFYQWSFNATNPIAGATNATLTLTNVQLSQAGNYAVLVTNAYGSALSSNAVLTVNPTPPCDPPPSGLVSWWQAEGNALDTAGTNNGVLDGGVTYGPGEVGQAFVFSGNGSAVQLGSAASLQLQTFSIEAWVQRTGSAIVSGGTDELLIGAGNNGYGFGFKSDGRLFLTQIGDTAVTIQAGVTNTNWHHVAVTLSGGAVVFYLDGVAYSGGAYSPGFASGSVALGARGDNLQNNLVGSLDELAVYNRALTAAEIQLIYSVGAEGKCPISPIIVTQPTNETVNAGSAATFAVVATGSRPLSYQWSFNGTNTLAGATNAVLSLTNVQPAGAGTYSVTVTNLASTATSSNAVLTVLTYPPVIVTQPTNETVNAGSAATFTAVASGTAPLSYQWLFNGTNTIAGATNAVLSLLNVQPAGAGTYSVIVTNLYGMATSSNALLTVLTFPPTITSQPTNVITYVGYSAVFTVAATGTPPLGYQWIYDGGYPIAGATNTSLTLSNLQFSQSGNYEVLVTNAYGSAQSSNAVLTVNPTPLCDPPPSGLVSWWKAEGNALDAAGANNGALQGGVTYGPGEVGQAFVFSGSGSAVQLGGPASLQLQTFTIETWVKRAASAIIPNGTDELLIGAGNNGYGFGFKSAGQLFLTQIGDTAVTIQAGVTDTNWHHVAVTLSGGIVVFYVDGVAYSGGSYSPAFASGNVALGARGDNLQNNLVGSLDELAVYNRALAASEIQAIYRAGSYGKCPPAIIITTEPVSVFAASNCSASFSATVAGRTPLGYQWWKDGVALPGQTSTSLLINSIQSSNFGSYFLVASNAYGNSVASSNAILALEHPPITEADVIGRFASGGVRFPASLLLTNDTDVDGDSLTVISVSSNSFANGTVSLQTNWIYYTPPADNTNSDIFTYTVSDGNCGGTATGFVTVQLQPNSTPSGTYLIQAQAGGSIALNFYGGIPGMQYQLQYTESLNNPNWQNLGAQTADSFGGFQFIDFPPANVPTRYYRSVLLP